MKLLKIYLVLSLLFSAITLLADPIQVLPKFNNLWYTQANDTGEPTVCNPNMDAYTYENKYTTEELMKNFIISSLPKHTDCLWQPLKLGKNVDPNPPVDFPGDSEDYGKVSQDGIASTLWSTDCLDNTGHMVDEAEGEYYPSYICPASSKRDDLETRDYHCFQYKNFSCEGDVAGRDLNTPIFSGAGHVGLITGLGSTPSDPDYYGSLVLEILADTDPIIQLNSLGSFVNKVPNHYWGTKYSLKQYPDLDVGQSTRMLILGINQIKYNPSYTLSWFWWPGGPALRYVFNLNTLRWEEKLVILNGQFRCDSFVYFLFKYGANVDIPYSPIMTPLTIFNTFLNFREPNSSTSSYFNNSPINTFSLQNQDDLENEIRQLFSQSSLDSNQADQLTYTFINDSSITRAEKISFLWNLSKQYQNDSQKFVYLVGILSFLKPTENASDIISIYNQIVDQNEKLALLELMNYSIYYDTLQETQALTQDQLNGIILIERFLPKQLTKTTTDTIYKRLFLMAINLSSKDEIKSLLSLNTKNKIDTTRQTLVEIHHIFSDVTHIDEKIENLFNDPKSESFNIILCGYISTFPSKYLNLSQKQLLLTYLKDKKSSLITKQAKYSGCQYDKTIENLS